jgi:serine/threonine protein kinase
LAPLTPPSPQVLLDSDGHTKLTDFGLSRFFETRPSNAPKVGDTYGTIRYKAGKSEVVRPHAVPLAA